MEGNYCQSCGLPIGATDKRYVTLADGSKTYYCKHCLATAENSTNQNPPENTEAENKFCRRCGNPMTPYTAVYKFEGICRQCTAKILARGRRGLFSDPRV